MSLKAVANRAPVVQTVHLVLNSAAVDQDVFIADRKYQVVSISESHGTAGSDTGSVTLDVTHCTGTTAAASGTSILNSTFNLKSTANTPVQKTVVNGGIKTSPTNVLSAGDRLAFNFTGTTTAYADGVVTIVLVPVTGDSTY